MDKKRLTINMVLTLVSFLVNMGISFFLTPYILKTVGKEAYGFVGLANDFVSYAQLVVIALNSMASRFITIRLYKNDIEGANCYFTSTLFADIFLSVLMFIPSIFIILFLDKLVNVPKNILGDVKLLWIFVFANFIIGIITAVFGVAQFAKNRLDISARISLITNILRAIIIFISFSFFKASVWYIGLAAFLCAIFSTISDIYYLNKLLPEININKIYFKLKCVKELISAGIWNAIGSLNAILMTGVDLLISNIFIDAASMGLLSIVKVVPNFLNNFSSSIVSVFVPQITIDYAKSDKNKLIKSIESSIMIICFFTSIPIGIFITSCDVFYKFWLKKGYDFNYLKILVVVSTIGMFISASMNIFNNVLAAANKVKFNSIIAILSGILNVIIVFILLKTTSLGLIAIAGTSTIIATIRSLMVTPAYVSKVLKCRWNIFYPIIFRNIVSVLISIVIGYIIINKIFIPYTWIQYILACIICSIICYLLYLTILLKADEKKVIKDILKKVLRIWRKK